MDQKTLVCVVGARPNFMKVAPIIREIQAVKHLKPYLVHTGQHYDQAMKDTFFQAAGFRNIGTAKRLHVLSLKLCAAIFLLVKR